MDLYQRSNAFDFDEKQWCHEHNVHQSPVPISLEENVKEQDVG
jgi:hypothetical protein